MCYESSCDTKDQPFQYNVLLKQVDQKKQRPTYHSERAPQTQLVFLNLRSIINTVNTQ